MIKKSDHPKKIDLGMIFESTLLGVFVIIGRYFNSLYLYTRNPATFVGALDAAGQTKATKKYSTVRPLTFLTISLGLLILANLSVIRARGNSVEIRNYESGDGFNAIFLFVDALRSFDIQKIVLALSPWVLLTGLFSYMLTWSAQGKGFVFSFEKSIGLSSYFCGSAACALMAPAPLITYLYLNTDFASNAQTELWVTWLWLIFFVLLGLRYFYAYLSVLRAELKTNMKTSLLVWVGGLWRFVIGFFVIGIVVGIFLIPLFNVAEYKWRPLAEQGNAEAQYKLGVAYDNGEGVRQNDKEAVLWYRRAADQGFAKAQNSLGLAYFKGRGVPQNYAEAVKWYRKAVEQGNALAQNSLGVAYYYGRGVPQNYEEAVKWVRKAVEQGDDLAQFNLGVAYYNGQGVSHNYEEAVKWFRKAMVKGNAKAQNSLGASFENAQGVPQNNVFAYMLFSIAATGGDKEAVQNRDLLQKKMTPAEITKGKELAAEVGARDITTNK